MSNQGITIWGHFSDEKDWSINGYTKLLKIETADHLQQFNVKVPSVTCAMFFAMKGDIQPLWEDKNNIGFWSYKVHKKFCNAIWQKMVAELLANCPQIVNGLTISPKRNFCIIKLYVNANGSIGEDIIEQLSCDNMDWNSGQYKDF